MSKVRTYSVTIGIPAFNEAANIVALINDILKQTGRSTFVEKIVVYSDASTDQTVTLVKSLKNSKVQVIDGKTRKGKAVGLNTIFKKSTSDIVVILDADVRILDKHFIEKLCKPLFTNSADLTSAKVIEFRPKNMLQHILKSSMELKRSIFKAWNNGDNLYTCHGRSRAFAKTLYQKLSFPFSPSEDAYSYLQCKALGFRYAYVDTTAVYYYLPETFADHVKQSLRFFQHDVDFAQYITKNVLQREYGIPFSLKIAKSLQYFIKHPLEVIAYIAIVIYVKVVGLVSPVASNQWSISSTSKRLSA